VGRGLQRTFQGSFVFRYLTAVEFDGFDKQRGAGLLMAKRSA